MSFRRFRQLLAVLVVLGAALVACGGTRPDPAAWLVTWDATVALVPDQATLGETPPKAQCDAVLAELREAQQVVIPSPDDSLDPTVNEWLMVAEGAFLECPPMPDGFAAAYRTLMQLEDEVTDFLATG